MEDPRNKPFDFNAMLEQRAADAWGQMPSDVAIALRKQLLPLNPITAIKQVGRYYKAGRWSIRPYPDVTGWGELGLAGATVIVKRLRDPDA